MSAASFSVLSSPLVSLLLQSAGMLVGTLICGTIPLHVPLSKTKLRVLEVMGAGLLVGASMTVVLPEGVSALFKTGSGHEQHLAAAQSFDDTSGRWAWSALTRRATEPTDGHEHGGGHSHSAGPESLMGFALLGGFLVMFLWVASGRRRPSASAHTCSLVPRRIDQIAAPGAHASSQAHSTLSERNQQRSRPTPFLPSHRPEALRLTRASSLSVAKMQDEEAGAEQSMYLPTGDSSPEQLPADHDSLCGHQTPLLASAGDRTASGLQSNARRLSDPGDREGGAVAQSRGLRGAFASIAGLVIHAAADGIAMGASAGSGDDSLKLIVLFAIMIHKAVSRGQSRGEHRDVAR